MYRPSSTVLAPGTAGGRPLALAALVGALGAALFAASAYAISPLVLPGLVLVIALAVLAWKRPAWALAATVLLTPAELVSLPLPSGALSPAETGLAIVALAWLGRALFAPETVVLPSVRDLPILVLLGTTLVGLTVAVDTAFVIRIFVLWTLFYFVYLQAQSLSPAEIRWVLIAFVVAAGILGTLGAVAFLTSNETTLFEGGLHTGERATGTFVDANYYASLLIVAIVPGVALAFADFKGHGWLLLPLAGGIGGVVFSLSRGGIAGLAFGLLSLLLMRRARLLLLVLVPVVAASTLLGLTPFTRSEQLTIVGERLGTLNRSLSSRDARPRIWGVALEMTAQHPFTGVGARNFGEVAGNFGLFDRGSPVENAHNTPLSFAAENGVFGAAAFIFLVVQLLFRAFKALSARDRLARAVGVGLLGGLLGFLLQSLTQAQLRVNVVTGVFFLLGGFVTALSDSASKQALESRTEIADGSRAAAVPPTARTIPA